MTICFTGGGTLGSVTPLLALAPYLHAHNLQWIGTDHGPERQFIEEAKISFFSVPSMKLRRYFSLQNLYELPKLYFGISKSKKILQKIHPACIISAGSYVSVPVCYAAKSLGIPYLLLQLDMHVGLANRLLEKKSHTVFVSVPELRQRFRASTLVMGIPTQASALFPKRERIPFPTLCIFGGGTGSQWINSYVADQINQLLPHMNVTHIQGNTDRQTEIHPAKNAGSYTSFNRLPYKDLLTILQGATVICARSGMGTIADCAALHKPLVCVPMPHSHQEANAQYFLARNACIASPQHNGYEKLTNKIVQLSKSPEQQDTLGNALHRQFPENSAKIIAAYIENHF